MKVQSYLFFEGRCEEALEFYKEKIGAKVTALMRYSESPAPPREGCTPPPGDKVMHANFSVGETQIMASDGNCSGKPNFQGAALVINVDKEPEAERIFGALSEGGQVFMPLEKTFFSPKFGMLNDKFGLMWMVITAQE